MNQLGFFSNIAVVPDRGAKFSPCRTWRYELWWIWDRELPVDLWVLVNPSKAGEKDNDPTVINMAKRVKANGRGGYRLVNLFAFVDSDPSAVLAAPDPIGPDNDRHISELAAKVAADDGKIIAAWGSTLDFKDPGARPAVRGRDAAVLSILAKHGDVYCIGRSGPGGASPTHPLARGKHLVPVDRPFEIFVGTALGSQAPKRIVKSFAELPPSALDRPAAGSVAPGPCVWCEVASDGRYGVEIDGRVYALCELCGRMAHPGYDELAALVRYNYRSCGACDTPGPAGTCKACGGEIL